MKKIISVATLVVLVFVGSALMEASAQTPPAPPATGNGGGGTPMGGNAPIGGGAALLIALGAGYAWKKLRNSGEEKI